MTDYVKLFQALVPVIEKSIMVLEHVASSTAVNAAMVQPVAAIKSQFGELAQLVQDAAPEGDRLAALEKTVADLHAALSDAPAPAGVQKAVADVEVPRTE